MRGTATWGAAAVLALAVAGISTRTRGPEEPSGTREVSQRGAKGSTSQGKAEGKNKAETKKACADIEEALQEFLLTWTLAAPDDCYGKHAATEAQSDEIRKKASKLKFVIAILPDPLHTHLSLLFDREAEAIQQAAGDGGYVYDSSWLPWDTEEQTYTYINDQDKADSRKDDREDQPGILLFRKHEPDEPYEPDSHLHARQPFREGLVVFVVGEEATRGIHRPQFKNAAAWIEALEQRNATEPPEVSILGPTFSGSLPSLAELLSDQKISGELQKPRKADKQGLNIYSGSVTSRSAAVWFGTVAQDDPKFLGWRVSFRSFLQSDDEALKRYCAYAEKLGPGSDKVALISEDETAYGSSIDHIDPQGPNSGAPPQSKQTIPPCVSVSLYYPRDISALRTAYQTESIFSSGALQSSTDIQRRILPSDLADPAGQSHDTIQSYGGNQDALSQEADLLAIVSVLRARDIAYLVLRSSNTLDALFLSNFFRRAYPQGRVVIMGSDLLFQRERGSAGISGVMMLSTYPLLPWEQDWTSSWDVKPGSSHRYFAEDSVEGTYVAGRFLLHDPPPTTMTARCGGKLVEQCFLPILENGLNIPDYEAPRWAIPNDCEKAPEKGHAGYTVLCPKYLHPATWLSVMGRDDFYPLAALSDTDPYKTALPGSSVELELPISMKLCLVGILVFAVFHLYCCGAASFTARPAFRTYFAMANPTPFGEWRHRTLIFAGSELIAFLAVIAVWGCGLFSRGGGLESRFEFMFRYFILVTLVALFSLLANEFVVQKLSPGENTQGRGLFSCCCRRATVIAAYFLSS